MLNRLVEVYQLNMDLVCSSLIQKMSDVYSILLTYGDVAENGHVALYVVVKTEYRLDEKCTTANLGQC